MAELSHLDENSRPKMVNVVDKKNERRYARAIGNIRLETNTIALIKADQIKKGSVLTIAQIAGIQAVKKTSEIIPLCHPIIIDGIDIKMQLTDTGVSALCEVTCIGRTGVEMEALAGVSATLLTVYDMCKAVDKNMVIENIHLEEKVKSDVE